MWSLPFHYAQGTSYSDRVLTASNVSEYFVCLADLNYFCCISGGLPNTGKKLFTWAVSVAWNAKSWTKFPFPAALTMFLQAAGSVFRLLNVWGKHTNLSKALQQDTPDVLGTNKSYIMPLQTCLLCRLLVAAFSWSRSKAYGRNNTCSWSNWVVL